MVEKESLLQMMKDSHIVGWTPSKWTLSALADVGVKVTIMILILSMA